MLSNNAKAIDSEFKKESAERSEDFVPFQPTELRSAPIAEIQQEWVRGDAAFKIKSGFWEKLLQDAWIQKEIERVISERSKERYSTEFEPKLKSELEKGYKEGYEKGLKEGSEKGEAEARAKVEEDYANVKKRYSSAQEYLLNRVNDLCLKILEDKSKILEEHSVAWASALADVIQKTPMAAVPGWQKKLGDWFTDRLEPFRLEGKVHVVLSPEEYASLKEAFEVNPDIRWQLDQDEFLKTGEVRIDCGDGGLFFSKDDCVATILRLMHCTSEELEKDKTSEA